MVDIIRIGTYNTNNLYDRFDDPYSLRDDPWRAKWEGTTPKKQEDLYSMGARIRSSDVHILAVQEIESFGALRDFVQGHVGPEYKAQDGIVCVPSNDPRGIDLGVLSKFPIGRVISHRFRKKANKRIFSRDCLEVEILSIDSNSILLTTFVCHLKSKYSKYEPGTAEYEADQTRSNEKRAQQVKETIEIVKASQNIETDCFVILGDMNDTPDAEPLTDFLKLDNELKLTNALSVITQDDESAESIKKRKRDTHRWTRYNESGEEFSTYSQLDYIFLSQALARGFTGKAKVEQRNYTGGSDHYLCWVEIDLNRI
jgi:endonuclease/exonuclease/phosphatase family metal-dependent hydrolase